MNTTENTPAHCHDCNQFADCHQAQNMMADTEPVEGWVYYGGVCCAKCDGDRDSTPYEGESDNPTHCVDCGVPIIHDLTDEGLSTFATILTVAVGKCGRLFGVLF